MAEKRIAAIYARVSTDKQTVDMQVHELKQYIKRRKWKLGPVFEDQAYSGSTTKRPAFLEMMEQGRKRKFDIVLVWKLDRFGRSLKDLVTALDDLSAWGIDFVSYSDSNIDTTTPTGKLVFHVIGAVAEFERELTSERVKAGLENAKRKGKRLGRPRIPAHLHEKIQDLLKKGQSNRAIARDLNISEGSVRNFRKAATA